MNAAAARDDHEDGRERRRSAASQLRRPPRTPATTTDAVWIARLAHRTAGGTDEHSLLLVNSDRLPAGTPVDVSDQDARGRRPTGWLVDVRYRACDGRVLRIDVSETVAAPAPPLWFAEIAHATSDVPSASVVAFGGDAFPPGTLVTPSEVCARGLTMSGNVGELRWWTRSGLVETVTVAPELAGRGVDRVLAALAGGIAMLRNWPPLLHPSTDT